MIEEGEQSSGDSDTVKVAGSILVAACTYGTGKSHKKMY